MVAPYVGVNMLDTTPAMRRLILESVPAYNTVYVTGCDTGSVDSANILQIFCNYFAIILQIFCNLQIPITKMQIAKYLQNIYKIFAE